jgi:hypothetical protein
MLPAEVPSMTTTLLILAPLSVYFLPSLVANVRGHRQLCSIQAVNLLLGWTLIGWAVALSWACSARTTGNDAGEVPAR